MTSAYFICDSIGDHGSPAYPAVLSARLGWTPTVDSWDGTGYLNDTPSPGVATFRERLPACIAAAPNVVFVEGGQNDMWYTVAALGVELPLFFAALRTGLPAATIYATAVWPSHGEGPVSGKADISALIRAAVTNVRGIFVDCLTIPWLTGTGTVAAPAGDGNQDVYVSADATHPTSAGAAYIGTRLAFAIRPPATGLAGSF
jgi:lysophospholipase L1-like esterase